MESKNTSPQLRNVKAHVAEQTPKLPEEIIEEILAWLPVKSLLKFRCVSKSWRSLIGSKRFIKTHLENSAKNTTFARHMIISTFSLACLAYLKLSSLHSLLNEPVINLFKFEYSINFKCESSHLVGCCDGLVCILLNRKSFVLWNPSTRMSKKLPDIDDNIEHGVISMYGFGYDESSGGYKVFAVIILLWLSGSEAISKVYSLKTNSWKTIKGRDVFPLDRAGKFVSGMLHWRCTSWDCRHYILSFNLKSEVFGVVEEPCYSGGVCDKSLGVLGGCLCVVCDYQKNYFDVWVMKQYGVKDSWYKVVTIPHNHCHHYDRSLTPFCIGSDGEILLTYGSTFIIYSQKDNMSRNPLRINLCSFCEAGVYIESLVSLVPDGEQETQTPETVVRQI